jgi:hypothetical protein
LIEQAAFARRAAGFADKFYWINFEQKGCGATRFCGFGIEDERSAERERDRMELARALVQ